MSSFLHQLANRLLQAHGNDLSTICVVMPSRRAGVFFRKALGDSSTQAIWAPAVQSIEDFVMERSGVVEKTKKATIAGSPFSWRLVFLHCGIGGGGVLGNNWKFCTWSTPNERVRSRH